MSSILARLVLLCAGSLLLFANVAQCQQDWTQAQRTCVNQCMTSGAACSAANCGFTEVCPANLGSMMTRRCYGCFYPTMPGFTFDQSQARCQQLSGANLVSVHSQAEYTILRNLITSTPNPDGKHHSFWLGMRLARNAQGTVSGAAWNDGTPLDFGNPVSGRGQSPWAVGEPVNAGNCVRMMGWGPFQNLWYDADCNQATNLVPTIGYFCKGCPTGWSMFNGRCYKAIVFPNNQDFTFAQLQNMCTAFNSRMVSIHSQAENNFVFNLVTASFPTVPSIALGIQINRAANGALQSLQWVDGSPVDFGATTTGGVAPWATPITGFPAQPDNRPAQQTTGCTMMWIDEAVPATKQPGRWDDVTCTNNRQRGTVCKF